MTKHKNVEKKQKSKKDDQTQERGEKTKTHEG